MHSSKQNTEGMNKVRGLIPLDFKASYKCTIIKTVWFWQTDTQTDQRNIMESSEMDPYKLSQLIFDKEAKAV